MKYKIQANDNSYYPGINHSSEIDVELEEYIFHIHKYVDWALSNTRLRESVMKTAGMPRFKMGPYVPLISTPTVIDDDAIFIKRNLASERYGIKIISKEVQCLVDNNIS